jgi:hypothetical protein
MAKRGENVGKVISTILNLKDNFSNVLNKTTANVKKFQDQAKKSQSAIGGLSGAVHKAGSGIASTIAGLGIGYALEETARKSIMLASDLNEVQNVVDVTFGNSSKAIDEWSSKALNAYGLSTLQAKQFTGTLGALMKSSGISSDKLVEMSEKMAGLSGDFASFYNLRPEEAFEKIKSGISGETEPLKALGINMSVANLQESEYVKTLGKKWDAMSQGEQTMARYMYLMKASKDAQSDFTRTSSSFANQLRIAKVSAEQAGASIGSIFLPALNKVLNKINEGGLDNKILKVKDSVSGVINYIMPSLQNLWAWIVKFGEATGLSSFINSIKTDLATGQLDTLKWALKEVLDDATAVVSFITDNWGEIAPIVYTAAGAFVAYKIAVEGALIIQSLSSAITIATGLIDALRMGVGLVAIAQDLWNAAMIANPIGAVITALALLGLAIYEVVKHWQDICTWIEKAWNWLTKWNGTKAENKSVTFTQTRIDDNRTIGEKQAERIGKNATGTSYSPGGLTLVGEYGRELVEMPQGAKVHTASQTKDILSGGTTIILNNYFNGNVGTEEFFDQCGTHIYNKVSLAMQR